MAANVSTRGLSTEKNIRKILRSQTETTFVAILQKMKTCGITPVLEYAETEIKTCCQPAKPKLTISPLLLLFNPPILQQEKNP